MRVVWFVLAAGALSAADLYTVTAKPVERSVPLPGELRPYQQVEVNAKISGFVDKIHVDVGSAVAKGQLLAELVAPELAAQRTGAEARVKALESQRAEAEARVVAAQSTYERLKEAAKTPGAIAGNELIQAEKSVDAAQAQVRAAEASIQAAQAGVSAVREIEAYLKVTAPFAGVITERLVHPGALARPEGPALFRLEQNSRLRLIVSVPETYAGGIPRGARVAFTVPAYPDGSFTGSVARVPRSMDPKTRSMPVELDVANSGRRLTPGMYANVKWPVRTGRAAVLVPPSSVVTTTERTFVVRASGGVAEWVDVRKGAPAGELLEVFGPLQPGDRILRRATDEAREGTRLQ